jgi:hypothetical protein
MRKQRLEGQEIDEAPQSVSGVSKRKFKSINPELKRDGLLLDATGPLRGSCKMTGLLGYSLGELPVLLFAYIFSLSFFIKNSNLVYTNLICYCEFTNYLFYNNHFGSVNISALP